MAQRRSASEPLTLEERCERAAAPVVVTSACLSIRVPYRPPDREYVERLRAFLVSLPPARRELGDSEREFDYRSVLPPKPVPPGTSEQYRAALERFRRRLSS